VKPLGEWHQRFSDVDNRVLDLRDKDACRKALRDTDIVYNLAADTGGRGFVAKNRAVAMLSAVVNTQLLEVARECGVERFFFASSASAGDGFPAMPEDASSWEKLFSERMCRHYSDDFALTTRIARLQNIYGSWGRYEGGREKAPAAICRKVAEAVMTGRREIAIWGDGEQTRSFTYINDCIEGIQRIAFSDVEEPLNLGTTETASINQLLDIVEGIADVKLKRTYDLTGPTSVSVRTSDNTQIQALLNWEPSTSLQDGLEETYRWIFDEINQSRYAEAA
jgi:nucleoside-diphosphate-sugar epimerase